MTAVDETEQTRTEGGPTAGPAAAPAAARPRSQGRRVLVGALGVLACIAIALSTVVVWAHQVALNTDRFVALVGPVAQQPDVVASVSDRLATQIATRLELERRITAVLPSQAAFLADPLATAITNRLETAIGRAMASPRFGTAWTDASRVAHEQFVSLLRGSNDLARLQGESLDLNVIALAGAALQQLQSTGFIPASVQLPDLSSGQVPANVRDELQTKLGVTLPADFGTVPIADTPRLAAAQQVVHVADIAVIVLPIVAIVLAVATVVLADDRRRTIIALSLGTAIALVVAVVAIRAGEQIAVASMAAAGGAPVVRALLDELNRNLTIVAAVVIGIALLVALIAWVTPWLAARNDGRPTAVTDDAI